MRVLNGNFNFTVKVGDDHFGGHFSYHRKGADVVKIRCRKLLPKKSNGYPYERINYLRLIDGKWVLWDMSRRAPKLVHDLDASMYAIFREAYGLAMVAEA